MARNVRDCAILSEGIFGHDPRDSTSVNQPVPNLLQELGQDIKGLRIGIPRQYFVNGMNQEVESLVRDAIRKLTELGAIPVEIDLPHTEAALSVYYILAPAEASSNLGRFDGIRYGYRAKDTKDLKDLYARSRSEGFGREVKRRIMIGSYVLSSGYYDAYYLHAQKVRTLIANDFKSAFESKCDLIVCPTAPTTAFRIGAKASDPLEMYLNDIFTIPLNLAGLPGMSIPCGFDQAGLPVGLQIIGRAWDEKSIFRVASAYEAATEWHLKRPVLN
jgi:aspartyl-tRNA(Asn)/glutamyl-tRNA(Gln) amidotransferase subunit A